MQEQTNGAAPRKSSVPYLKTDTPGVYRRSKSYVAGWHENGVRKWRTFPTYEAACAFRRDYVIPFRERRALPPTVAAPRGMRGRGFVYLLQSKGPDAHVKIGWSQDVARRISDLCVAHPYGVDLVGLILGPRKLETQLHERFKHLRIGREWFSQHVLSEFMVMMLGGVDSISTPPTPNDGAEGGDLQEECEQDFA